MRTANMRCMILAVAACALALDCFAVKYEACGMCDGKGKLIETCAKCNGEGGWYVTKRVKSSSCKVNWSSGFRRTSTASGYGYVDTEVFMPCDKCFRGLARPGSKGEGVLKRTCPKCKGRKVVPTSTTKKATNSVTSVHVNVSVEVNRREVKSVAEEVKED